MSNLAILAAPRATAEQCIRFMLARPHGEYSEHDIKNVIVPAYFCVATSVGLDPAILVAQMIHETGGLASWWSQRPRRNPAGIGVTGQSSLNAMWTIGIDGPIGVKAAKRDGIWYEGISFPDWAKDAIPAHVGRMLAYARRNDELNDVQRALVAKALSYRPLPASYRGAARTLRGLAGRWAVPGTEYSGKIAALVKAFQA
jgi:hypothetical protein